MGYCILLHAKNAWMLLPEYRIVTDAQVAIENPERYPDVLVRMAGLSACFADLSRLEQEELIARAGAVSG